MELYLLRHGIAEVQQPGEPDSARALTTEGRVKLEAVLKAAKRAGMAPSVILSSPYLRARQTAEMAAAILKFDGQIIPAANLTPDSDPSAAWSEIRDFQSEPSLLIASHEPFLSQFAALLLGAPSLRIEVKKASLIRIDVQSPRPAPSGILRWMLTPGLVIS